jgi:hypothetical protein
MALDNERALENSWESLPKDKLYTELSRYAATGDMENVKKLSAFIEKKNGSSPEVDEHKDFAEDFREKLAEINKKKEN